jgi:hypothetical protein
MALLLYCANGQVIGAHDDQQPFVDPASYGTGVRIIPYPQSMATLPVIDAGPPTVYGQPAETTALLLAYAAQQRVQAASAGISFTPSGGGTIPVNTDRTDAGLMNNLATWATSVPGSTAVNFTQDNVCYAITANDAEKMFNQVMAHVQDCRNVEAACIADLNSGTPTIKTYDDVDAKFAGVFAETLLGERRRASALAAT